MTEKRFILVKCYNEQWGVVDKSLEGDQLVLITTSKSGTGYLVNELNKLNNENKQLKARIEHLERKIQRERVSYQKEHEKWEKEIQKENKQLKQQLQEEQCRTTPITLTTHISDDDFKKIELIIKKYFGDLE